MFTQRMYSNRMGQGQPFYVGARYTQAQVLAVAAYLFRIVSVDVDGENSEAQARTDAIVKVIEDPEVQCKANEDRVGLTRADAECDDLYNRVEALVERIRVTPATTVEGLRVKARLIEWSERGQEELPAESIARSIICDLSLSDA